MTGTITNLESGEERTYASVKERNLIIRAWQRMGCWGVQISPKIPHEYVQSEADMLKRKMRERYGYYARYWKFKYGRRPPATLDRYIELVQQYGTIKKAHLAKQL